MINAWLKKSPDEYIDEEIEHRSGTINCEGGVEQNILTKNETCQDVQNMSMCQNLQSDEICQGVQNMSMCRDLQSDVHHVACHRKCVKFADSLNEQRGYIPRKYSPHPDSVINEEPQGDKIYIKYRDGDFLNRKSGSGVYAATSDFRASYGLLAEFRRKHKSMDLLFHQYKRPGSVVISPKTEFNNWNYQFFMVVTPVETIKLSYSDVKSALWELKKEANRLGVVELAFPAIDLIRKMPWGLFVRMLNDVFMNEAIAITIYKHYYLSLP